jgi:hypothetical protein
MVPIEVPNALETIGQHNHLAAAPYSRPSLPPEHPAAMTIHFAAAQTKDVSPLVRLLTATVPLSAANDNGGGIGGNRVLKAALRHFAEHGLSAANRARDNAEAAFFAGQSEEYRWWMNICITLDRRMTAVCRFERGAAPLSK